MLKERHFIRKGQFRNFKPAVRLAEKRGTPLNLFVTLNFAHTEIGPKQVPAAFEKIRRSLFNRWYRRPSKHVPEPEKSSAFLWVQEAAGGVPCVHWLVHIPEDRQEDFEGKLAKWLIRVAGKIDAGAIEIQQAYHPLGVAKYLGKGIDPGVAKTYGIKPVDQGKTYGKRSGFSRSLNPSECVKSETYWTQMDRNARAPELRRKADQISFGEPGRRH